MGLKPLNFWSRVFFCKDLPNGITFPNLPIIPGRGNSMAQFQQGGLVRSHVKRESFAIVFGKTNA